MADLRLATCLFITFGVLLAYFMNKSPPSFSEGLTKWINKGKFFTYNGHKIFYIGKNDRSQFYVINPYIFEGAV